MSEDIDRLKYERFLPGSTEKDARPDEFLLETQNFFVLVGSGAFVKGYVLVVSKDENVTSFAAIPPTQQEEAGWLIDTMSKVIQQTFSGNVIQFEHGMCACAGADHAHFHIMPVSNSITREKLINAMDSVLRERVVGIENVQITSTRGRQVLLTNPHDIAERLNNPNPADIFTGTLKTYDDLEKEKPRPPSPWFNDGQNLNANPYVYFNVSGLDIGFMTNASMGSQVGRQMAFTAEVGKAEGGALQDALKQVPDDKALWRWQDYKFTSNMMETAIRLRGKLTDICCTEEGKKFGMKVFEQKARPLSTDRTTIS